MAILTQPTGAEITAYAAATEAAPMVGGWSVETIDDFISALPYSNHVTLEFNEAVTLLTAAGLDPNSLTNAQLGFAQAALLSRCIAVLLSNWANITNYVPNESGRENIVTTTRPKAYFFNAQSAILWGKLGIEPAYAPWNAIQFSISSIDNANKEIV